MNPTLTAGSTVDRDDRDDRDDHDDHDGRDDHESRDTRVDRERRRIARRRAGARLGLLIHAVVFVAVNAGLLLLDLATSPQVRWAHYPMLGWGLGLAIHGLVVLAMPVIASLHRRLVARELARMRA